MVSDSSDSAVLSPCIGVCTLATDEVCIGCLRTADEIVRWGAMSDAERGRVMEQLEHRSRVGGI